MYDYALLLLADEMPSYIIPTADQKCRKICDSTLSLVIPHDSNEEKTVIKLQSKLSLIMEEIN